MAAARSNKSAKSNKNETDVYVPPTAVADGFVSDGSVSLVRRVSLSRKMSRRAQSNVMELAKSGNTVQSRRYWTAVLIRNGVLSGK